MRSRTKPGCFATSSRGSTSAFPTTSTSPPTARSPATRCSPAGSSTPPRSCSGLPPILLPGELPRTGCLQYLPLIHQVRPANPAAAVQGPKHVVTKGRRPVLTPRRRCACTLPEPLPACTGEPVARPATIFALGLVTSAVSRYGLKNSGLPTTPGVRTETPRISITAGQDGCGKPPTGTSSLSAESRCFQFAYSVASKLVRASQGAVSRTSRSSPT